MTQTTRDHMAAEILAAGVLGEPAWAVLMITTTAGEVFRFGLPVDQLEPLARKLSGAALELREGLVAPGG